MSLWGSIKSAFKKVVRAVKAVVRVIVRIVITVINAFTLGLIDLVFGFLAWPPKRLRLHVFVITVGGKPVASNGEVMTAVDAAKLIYKKGFNVNILPYSESFVQVLTDPAPPSVVDYECGLSGFASEFGEAGEFFAQHLAGWNAIPISLTFPVTVFVVNSLKSGELGCSLSVIGDYVVIATPGLKDHVALAHEVGHTCGLWHSGDHTNLMYFQSPAGEGTKWFQRNILRSSRHVQYW
jgi:hypothetical protein